MIQLNVQNRKRFTDSENRFMDAGRIGEGIVREFGVEMYRLLYLKWITNRDLLYSTGNSAQCYEAALPPSSGKKGYVYMHG